MYVAVKGGETAILNSYKLLAEQRRGDNSQSELSVDQIRQQLKLAVDRVMTEGSVYDPELAALAIKQASGDLVEAIFCYALTARHCLAWVIPARWTRPACNSIAAFQRLSKICQVGRFWARPTITPSDYLTSP